MSADDADLARIYLRNREVPCLSCGYNLTDLRCSNCPECGWRIEVWELVAAAGKADRKQARLALRVHLSLCLVSSIMMLIVSPFLFPCIPLPAGMAFAAEVVWEHAKRRRATSRTNAPWVIATRILWAGASISAALIGFMIWQLIHG